MAVVAGCIHFEITELYPTWADGGPFPSALAEVPEGTSLIVDVRATDYGQPLFEARIAPLGDRETAPHLRWTAARGLLSRPGWHVPPWLHPEDDANIRLGADGAASGR